MPPPERFTSRLLTPAEFASYFRFAFVRNPWDRAVSAALWRSTFRAEGIRDLRDYIDWSEKVNAEKVNKHSPRRPSDSHAMPQCHFLAGDDGREAVACIGRFEHYERDLAMILGRFLKLPDPLPHNLPSDRRHYRDYYHGDLERRTARLFAQDVERFGYAF